MHRYYLRRLSVHQLDPEEISYLAELIGTSGFEKFSDDYFYSHLEHFLGLLPYGSSHYEMTIPQYAKKVRTYAGKMPDGYRRIYEWVKKTD